MVTPGLTESLFLSAIHLAKLDDSNDKQTTQQATGGQGEGLLLQHLALGKSTAHVTGAMSDFPFPCLTRVPLYELLYITGGVQHSAHFS